MRICIVEDDLSQSEMLKQMLLKQGKMEITSYRSAEEMLFECGKSFAFDLCILDIQMEQMNGMELARKIREIDTQVMIVFLTALQDYVFEGYEVNAVRYFLKPMNEAKCKSLIALLEEKQKEKQYLIIGNKRIDCMKISYIEAMAHYCVLYAKSEICEKISISILKKKLPSSFIFTHRSYIVNLASVEQITKNSCILSNQKEVPISRSLYKKVNQAFIQFYKEMNSYD